MKCKKCKCEKGEECFRAKRAKKLCKLCDRCRNFADARGRKYVAKDPVGYRQKQKDWMLTEKAIESHRRDLAAQKTTEARAQKAELQRSWRQTDNGKKYLQSDGYKESKKREYEKLMSSRSDSDLYAKYKDARVGYRKAMELVLGYAKADRDAEAVIGESKE